MTPSNAHVSIQGDAARESDTEDHRSVDRRGWVRPDRPITTCDSDGAGDVPPALSEGLVRSVHF